MSKVALYARVSTENQDLDSQEEKLVSHAEAQDWNYVLKSEKVSSIDERPEFEDIMDNLDSYDKLVVTKIDRFARSITDFNERMEFLDRHDVEFEAIDQPINTEDDVYGDFILKMLALFAELERKMIRRRMEEGFEKAKEEGRVGRSSALSDTEKDQVEALYSNKSYSYESLAEEFDVSVSTIYRCLKERDAV